jgi:hypothetical protein
LAYFLYQSHKFEKGLLQDVDIRRAIVDEGTEKSLEKTKKNTQSSSAKGEKKN